MAARIRSGECQPRKGGGGRGLQSKNLIVALKCREIHYIHYMKSVEELESLLYSESMISEGGGENRETESLELRGW